MTYNAPYSGLPDPGYQSEFYDDIPTKRFIAWIIDVVIVVLISIGISILTLGLGFFLFFGIMFIVGFLYRFITLNGKSATLGMRLVAIEMVRSEGTPFDTSTALLHTVGYYISMWFFLLQIVSIVLIIVTARKQSATDHVLGTAALNQKARY
ncbi:RDD family protein [Parasulfitobacter algicola]|uniref:RDD family protein n=1 Tax=Parasulfitobacter algicola TaxID=2614809 RepID=A0ABX2ISK6_9RHOB|nr:RDD family protein [Sulfitobacter algicola]NSX55295.1 RDD family protein [Sulfitobacter algicola]